MSDKLFTIRFKLSTGWITMTAWESPEYSSTGHTRLDCELRQNGKTIFPRGATYCGTPGHMTIDGDDAKELVASLFAMKPGDTDSEYFESYTPDQLEWAEQNGEELDLLKMDRYGER